MTPPVTVAQFLGAFLAAQREQQTTVVFEVVGGYITHILDTLERQSGLMCVSLHAEQACAFAADAWSRLTGVVGVCAATSGPGATNLLTGLGHAFFDGGAVLALTGAVNLHEMRQHASVRQVGFQEMDIVSMAKPVCKMSVFVGSGSEFPALLRQCYQSAREGCKGPVLMDIPIGVQLQKTAPCVDLVLPERHVPAAHFEDDLRYAYAELARAERPLILVGGGVPASHSIPAFRRLVEVLRVPVVFSLLAVDALPSSSPYRIGFIGSYGNRFANMYTMQSDVLVVLGSRLDMRQTGAVTGPFQARSIVHVDCEAMQINNRVKGCRAVVAHVGDFIDGLAGLVRARPLAERAEWLKHGHALRAQYPDEQEVAHVPGINVATLMHELGDSSVEGGVTTVTVDVGNHQMWAAQSLRLGPEQRFLTSGGMGAMGCALPMAIGAAFARPSEAVLVIAGDGGFQMNIQELQSVVHHKLPLKMVVLNNRCYGMVRQFQAMYLGGRTRSTVEGYSAPSFARVADAYGIASSSVEDPRDLQEHLRLLFQNKAEPYLLEVMLPIETDALPKIAFGKSMEVMDPAVPGTRIAPKAFITQ